MMRKYFSSGLFLAGICLLFLFSGCKQNTAYRVPLGKRIIVIEKVTTNSYSRVCFSYALPLPNNQVLLLHGGNSASGYYYKKYSLKEGDRVFTDVSLIVDGNSIWVENIDFSRFEIK